MNWLSRLLIFLAFSPVAQAGVCEKVSSPDLSLALAIDVSASMDEQELRIQMDGYSRALQDSAVVENLMNCTCAELAVILWADEQKVMVPFTTIKQPGDLQNIVNQLQEIKPLILGYVGRLGPRTNMVDALQFAKTYIDQNSHPGSRQSLLVSGDGLDTYLTGTLRTIRQIKNQNQMSGLQVNGAPIELHFFQQAGPDQNTPTVDPSGKPYWAEYPEVEKFYRNEVATTDGFVIPAKDFVDLQRALTESLRILSCNLMM